VFRFHQQTASGSYKGFKKKREIRTEILYAAPQRCADVAIAGGETIRRIVFGALNGGLLRFVAV
jgi:hypothetical protein